MSDILTRYWSKVDRRTPHECWQWTAARDRNGYGRFNIHNVPVLAHRLSFMFLRGEIPQGTELDHLCRNTSCVNPAHLEAVTHRENIRRSEPATRTHCPKGHPRIPENDYVDKNGKRYDCRVCRCERMRARRTKGSD